MDNNNIGGMNPQQFSQQREQSKRNADFFGRLCIPTIIYALLYTIFFV